MLYEIFEGNFGRLEKQLNRIGNKCRKYGCDFNFNVVGETFREVEDAATKEKHIARFVVVEASGTAKVNNWEFVAELEHTANGNVIRGYGKWEVPERYYKGGVVCEHCRSNRYRKNTYIVRNSETGEFKQVGKSCLKDFTNGLSAEAVTSYISLFKNLIQGEHIEAGYRFERYIDPEELLRYAAEVVNKFGYVRATGEGESTREKAVIYKMICSGQATWMTGKEIEMRKAEMERVGFNAESEEVAEQVRKALEWLDGQDESNNYFHNLKVTCKAEYTSLKNAGIVVSLIPAYFKACETEKERAKREAAKEVSAYVGEVGKRVSFQLRSIKCLASWETMYGTTFLYKMVDDLGNVFTWKTGTSVEGDVSSVMGTIKSHTVYNGVKQTELTRCRVAA